MRYRDRYNLTLLSPVVRHPKIIAKTLFSRPRPPRDPGRGPVMPTGGAHRVIVSASGDSRAAGRTGHGRRRERPERVTTIVVYTYRPRCPSPREQGPIGLAQHLGRAQPFAVAARSPRCAAEPRRSSATA